MPLTGRDDPAVLPTRLPADPSRWVFRLPLSLLAMGIVGSGVVLLVRLVLGPSHALGNAAQAASRVLPICAAIAAYIRLVYVGRTRLVIDTAGLSLHQPFATRRAAWTEILRVQAAGPWMPTHRGGLPIAVRLTMRDGQNRTIPDVFSVRRESLATMIANAHRDHRA